METAKFIALKIFALYGIYSRAQKKLSRVLQQRVPLWYYLRSTCVWQQYFCATGISYSAVISCAAVSCACAVDNHGHTHQRVAITRLFTLFLALSISELPSLCQPEVLLKSRLFSLDYSSADPFSLLMVYKFTTVRYFYCVHAVCRQRRDIALQCSKDRAWYQRSAIEVARQTQRNCTAATQLFFALYCIYTVRDLIPLFQNLAGYFSAGVLQSFATQLVSCTHLLPAF